MRRWLIERLGGIPEEDFRAALNAANVRLIEDTRRFFDAGVEAGKAVGKMEGIAEAGRELGCLVASRELPNKLPNGGGEIP